MIDEINAQKRIRSKDDKPKKTVVSPSDPQKSSTTPTYSANNSIHFDRFRSKKTKSPVSRQKSWSWLITVMEEKWRRAKEAKISFAKRRETRGVVWSMMSERSGKDARYRRVHVRWYSAIKPPPSSLFLSSQGRQNTSDGTKFCIYMYIHIYKSNSISKQDFRITR